MQIETEQVVLTLTSDKNILSALRTNKAFRTDKDGIERLVRQFNSQDFEFRAGAKITVGRTVAACLKRDTAFIMGDGLTGPLVCPLVEVGAFEAGKGTIGVGDLVCPYCHTKFDTAPKLGRHLYRAASECPEYKAEEGDGGDTSEPAHEERAEEYSDPKPVAEPETETAKADTPKVVSPPAVRTAGPRIGRQG
jgi:hypothetical protein